MTRRTCASIWALVLGLLAVPVLGGAATAADATGTWSWTIQRGDNTIEQTLTLKQDGEKLTGTISGRQGNEIEIEDGKVEDGTISFKVTREFNGNTIVMTYKGELSEDTIKGETTFERNGEERTREWEAKRSKE